MARRHTGLLLLPRRATRAILRILPAIAIAPLLCLLPTACAAGAPTEGRVVRISVIEWQEDEPLSSLQVTVRANGRHVSTISAVDLTVDEGYGQPHSRWFVVPGHGEMTVSFRVAERGSGTVRIPLKPDWEREVQFHVADSDPIDRCFGCEGSERFEFSGLPGKHLYVVWGGNSISEPVVY